MQRFNLVKRFVIFPFLALFLLSTVVIAQDDDTTECNLDGALQAIADITTSTEEATIDTLAEIDALISEARIACEGFTFSSEEYGLLPVIGPITIPEGIYRATATTPGFFITESTPLSDGCGRDVERSWFILSAGEATEGAQVVIEVESDCELLLEISTATESWLIELERLG